MRHLLLLITLLVSQYVNGQIDNVFAKISKNNTTIEINNGSNSIVIFEIEIGSNSSDQIEGSFDFKINTDSTTLSESEFNKLTVKPVDNSFKLDRNTNLLKTINIELNPSIADFNQKILHYDVFLISNGQSKKIRKGIKIKLLASPNVVFNPEQYLKNEEVKLGVVTNTKLNNNILTLYGYKEKTDNTLLARKVKLDKNNTFVVKVKSKYFTPSISIISIPIKVRPAKNDFTTSTSAGFSNLGINVDLLGQKTTRYFSDGKNTENNLSLGFWLAPSVEELDSLNTNGFLDEFEKSKQLYISTGFSVSYSLNNINLSFIPLGIDLGTTGTSNKWIYDKNRWWGLGIGINPKIFSKN